MTLAAVVIFMLKSLRFDRAYIVVVGDIEIYKKYLNSNVQQFHD
jgi:hypothetical protein